MIRLMVNNLLLKAYLSREKRNRECLAVEVERLKNQSKKKTRLIRKLQDSEVSNFKVQSKMKSKIIHLEQRLSSYTNTQQE
jgi:hypothetical protein